MCVCARARACVRVGVELVIVCLRVSCRAPPRPPALDPPLVNASSVNRVRFPLRAEMHGRGHINDSCFIAFITSKIC